MVLMLDLLGKTMQAVVIAGPFRQLVQEGAKFARGNFEYQPIVGSRKNCAGHIKSADHILPQLALQCPKDLGIGHRLCDRRSVDEVLIPL